MSISLGQRFSSFEELDFAIKRYQVENYCVLVTRDSRSIEAAQRRLANKILNPALRYNDVKFSCHHGGDYRQRGKKGMRKTSTAKIGCPFIMQFRTTEDGQELELKSWKLEHNHEVSEDVYTNHHRTRRLDSDNTQMAEDMLKVEPDRKRVRQHLVEQTGKRLQMKDIHNVASNMKKERYTTVRHNMTSVKSPLTTHVLDTALGKPAENLDIYLCQQDIDGAWLEIAKRCTNADGRCPALLTTDQFVAGKYRLRFDTGSYFTQTERKGFYPYVDVVFQVENPGEHYHVPLLLSPYGYSTYRGS